MSRRTAIGLDIGTSSVRAAELSFSRDGAKLERFGQMALPVGCMRDGEVVDARVVAEAIAELWKAVKFSSKKVTLGLSNQRVVVRQVEVPYLEAKELHDSLALHVGDQVPMPVDESVLDFVPLEELRSAEGTRTLSGLLVAASEEMVVNAIQAVEQAGLTAAAVDLTSFAMMRALARPHALGFEQTPEAIVDIGAKVTNIVVHEGGTPTFVRILMMGGQDVTDALITKCDMDMRGAELFKRHWGTNAADSPDLKTMAGGKAIVSSLNALVEEIRGSLDYYSATTANGSPTRVLITGGGSQLPGLVEMIAGTVRLPVQFGSAFSGLQVGKTGLSPIQMQVLDPQAVVPVGLALGAAR